jgi:hypothetical protein
VGRAKNDNTSLEITVKFLPQPQKLSPPKNVYVVWLRPQNGPIENIGELWVDKDLEGELKTVTAMRSFEVEITAEPGGQVFRPTGKPVLWATYGG